MVWKYTVLSRTGAIVNGAEEGRREEVLERLREKKLKVLAITLDWTSLFNLFSKKQQTNSKNLSDFFEDFKNMLAAGLTPEETLISLCDTAPDKKFSVTLGQVRDFLTQGYSLAESIEKTGCFGGLVVNVIKVGEKAGQLEPALGDLAQYYRREMGVKSTIINASIYPVMVLVLLTALLGFIIFSVIPKLKEFLPKQALDGFVTRIVLAGVDFIRHFWFLGFFLLFGLIVCFNIFKKSSEERLAGFYYQIPLLGDIAKSTALALYFLNLAILQRSGVPLVQSLDEINKSFAGQLMAKKFMRCREAVINGSSFWRALGNDSFFPAFVVNSVKKGEEAGKIGDYFSRVADFYSLRTRNMVDTFLALFQPILFVVVGAVLILIIVAFILPIYTNLNTIAGGGR